MSENEIPETKPAEKTARGKRYSKEEVEEIISFIRNHNKQNKRGGQKVAAAKFGVSAVTISRWMKLEGKKASKKDSKPSGQKTSRKGAKRKSGKTRGAAAGKVSQDPGKTLARLGEIYHQMAELQAEYDALKESL